MAQLASYHSACANCARLPGFESSPCAVRKQSASEGTLQRVRTILPWSLIPAWPAGFRHAVRMHRPLRIQQQGGGTSKVRRDSASSITHSKNSSRHSEAANETSRRRLGPHCKHLARRQPFRRVKKTDWGSIGQFATRLQTSRQPGSGCSAPLARRSSILCENAPTEIDIAMERPVLKMGHAYYARVKHRLPPPFTRGISCQTAFRRGSTDDVQPTRLDVVRHHSARPPWHAEKRGSLVTRNDAMVTFRGQMRQTTTFGWRSEVYVKRVW